MSDIADAVQITKAGLYHFVESKEDLLMTIITYGMDRLEEEVIGPALKEKDPAERLKLVVRTHALNVGRVAADVGRSLSLVVDEASGLRGDNRRRIDARKRDYFALLRDTLEELRETDRLQPGVDTTAAAFSIIGAVMWIARWRKADGKLTLDEVAEQVSQIVARGLLNPDAPAGGEPEAVCDSRPALARD